MTATELAEQPLDWLQSDAGDGEGAMRLLRRGLGATPELRQGLMATLLMGLAIAVGRMTIPILVQQTIDRALVGDGDVDRGVLATTSILAAVIILGSAVLSWLAQRRLVARAEGAISSLRILAFEHIHRLSIADHNETKRGVLVARVTSDADALARFAQWGLFSWSINPIVILGVLAVLVWYSPVLALVVILFYLPVLPLFRLIQRRQIKAYDVFRTRVGDMLSSYSQAVTGMAVVKAYGAEDRSRSDMATSISGRYKSAIHASKFQAGIFVVSDLFGAVAMSAVLVVGLVWRAELNLNAGQLVACLFLVNLVASPLAELSETLNETQTAVAAWRKILNLLDREVDVVEAAPGLSLHEGPLAVEARDVTFAYRGDNPVIRNVSIAIPAGTNVAVVGQTGSGKSTFVKLLCRLADVSSGELLVGGVNIAEVSTESRIGSLRMVPQDGFLFDRTIRENVRFGRLDASDDDIVASFEALGLQGWLSQVPNGLDASVGERGQNLSVGERQLVALARAQLADPGLLVLDEATSAVDPEIDQALTDALRRLAEGRTVLSVAHRLSTAEAADLVLVFDNGLLVESGDHSALLANGGVYSELHRAWIGSTRSVDTSTRSTADTSLNLTDDNSAS